MEKVTYEKIPDEHLAAIGRFVDKWADLEFEIDQFIWDLMGVPQALGACLTSQIISLPNRINSLISIIKLYTSEKDQDALEKKLSPLTSQIWSLIEKRNRTIHDKRMIRGESKEVVRFQVSAKSILIFEPQPETIESLNELTNKTQKAISDFQKFREEISVEIQASLDIQTLQLPYIRKLQGVAQPVQKTEDK